MSVCTLLPPAVDWLGGKKEIGTFPFQRGYYTYVDETIIVTSPVTYFTKSPAMAMQYRNLQRSHRSSHSARSGFTLLELLLVLAILVMIIGIGVTNYSGVQDGTNVSATEITLGELKNTVKMYKIRMNSLPESLDMLRDGPSDAAKKAKWVSAIIEEIPKDSWENDLEYNVSGGSFEIRSAGLDLQMNTDDDLTVEG